MQFWEFTRAIGAEAGFPTRPEDMYVIPQWLGLTIASAVEWGAWVLGQGKPSMTRQGIRYSCLTRTFSIEKAQKGLGYKPAVSLKEGIERSAQWWITAHQEDNEKKRN
jgi:sterol-4alpha-carboxylate 3-dehydrogenase (decarboxylating)